MKTSDAAFGRSRGVIGTRSKRQRWRRRHEPGFPTCPEVGPTAGQVAMLVWLEQFLVRYPELALFLVIAAGYWIGSFKIGAFSLGPVTGALFAGLFVGQFAHVPVSGMTKSFLFLLFLFGIGYSVGPQFMQALKRDGLKPVLLAVVVGITGLGRFDPRCQSAAAGSRLCGGAHVGCPHPERRHGNGDGRDQRTALARSGPRTVCCAHRRCGCGLLHLRLCRRDPLLHGVAPALLKIDLRAEALKLEQALGMSRAKPGLASGLAEVRAARLSIAGRIPSGRTDRRCCRGARARAPAVHPPASPRRTHPRSRARHDAPSRAT